MNERRFLFDLGCFLSLATTLVCQIPERDPHTNRGEANDFITLFGFRYFNS